MTSQRSWSIQHACLYVVLAFDTIDDWLKVRMRNMGQLPIWDGMSAAALWLSVLLLSIEERIPLSPHHWAFPCIGRSQAAAATSVKFGELAQRLVIKDAIP